MGHRLSRLCVILSALSVSGLHTAHAVEINEVVVLPGSGSAFDFQDPDNSNVFISSESSVTGLPPASPLSNIFIAEYEPDGTLIMEVARSDPDFELLGGEGAVEGLSFFETGNLLFGEGSEKEAETESLLVSEETSHIKEHTTTTILPAAGGLNLNLTPILSGHFELEGVAYHPARDSIFVTGELEEGAGENKIEMPVIYELDKANGSVINSWDLRDFPQFQMTDAEGLGYNASSQTLLLVVNNESQDEEELSKLFEISVTDDVLNILEEIDLSVFDIGEAEGVSYDHATGTLFIAEEPEESEAPQ
jgi:hypothetical protein